MAFPQTVTITTASANYNTVDTTTYTKINLTPGKDAPTGHSELGHQLMRVIASCNHAAGALTTLRFVLKDSDRVYKVVTPTLTVTALRQGTDGASGNYLMTVVADSSDFIDLTGHRAASADGPEIAWYVGMTGTFTNATSLRLDLFPIRAN